MRPKDQDPKDSKSGVIYSYQWQDITCGEEYVGETSMSLGERHKDHLKGPSPIHVHIQQTGHNVSSDNFNMIGREDRGLARTIKDAIYIRVNNPSSNRNVGKYPLSHLFILIVPVFTTKHMFLNSVQYKVYLFWIVYKTGLAHSGLWLELELFLFDTISTVVV